MKNQLEAWEEVHRDLPWGLNPSPEFMGFLAQRFWGQTGLKFLDLGAGAGANTLWMAERGIEVTAVEASPTACNKLKQQLNEETSKLVKIYNKDVTKIFLSPYYFDGILIANLLEHIPADDAKVLIIKAMTWLKPQGKMFIIMHAEQLPDVFQRGEVELRPIVKDELAGLFAACSQSMEIAMNTWTFLHIEGAPKITHWLVSIQAPAL